MISERPESKTSCACSRRLTTKMILPAGGLVHHSQIKETSQRLGLRQLDAGKSTPPSKRPSATGVRLARVSKCLSTVPAATTPPERLDDAEKAPLAQSPASGILPQARFCPVPVTRIASRVRQPGELGAARPEQRRGLEGKPTLFRAGARNPPSPPSSRPGF